MTCICGHDHFDHFGTLGGNCTRSLCPCPRFLEVSQPPAPTGGGMTVFHFDCFAAMAVEYDSAQEPEDPQFIGMWLTVHDSDMGIKAYETARIKAHEVREDGWARETYGLLKRSHPPTVRYCIIPMRQYQGNPSYPWGDVETHLEQAALLRLKGVGA